MALPPFNQSLIEKICAIAMASPIAVYDWADRGQAPPGYTKGMAVAFATVVRKWLTGDSAAREMAQADTHDPDLDALAWYAEIFAELGMHNDVDGLDTLRHLFVLQIGLGMRESSGRHCCGRDMSADNVSADTCEAGLFQMSWNASACSDEIAKLADFYASQPPQCALAIFQDGVECSREDWQCYGSGEGFDYQRLAKNCPQFAVETAAIGLRNLRQHWGPINRFEAEVRPEADQMLQQVQELVSGQQAPIASAELSKLPSIVMSSGHSRHVRGAAYYIDEVDEARKVVDEVADRLRARGASIKTFHDDTSRSQRENLTSIVNFHNAQTRDLDVSVHFNASKTTARPMGTEVLYATQQELAAKLSQAIANAGGFINRGAKHRRDLFFLNNTEQPAVLLEICFVDSSADAARYKHDFAAICDAIAEGLAPWRLP